MTSLAIKVPWPKTSSAVPDGSTKSLFSLMQAILELSSTKLGNLPLNPVSNIATRMGVLTLFFRRFISTSALMDLRSFIQFRGAAVLPAWKEASGSKILPSIVDEGEASVLRIYL